jgi:HAD superfamily hydrolase (TIGR01509 family)
MPATSLDRFEVVLLDMNGTFMFGQDRFGPGEDFARTYSELGGSGLAETEVERGVRATYEAMADDEQNPARHDDFPQVADVLGRLRPEWPPGERKLIEEVIAVHELGHVPQVYADCLRELARTHRLGLATNLWSKKERWLAELRRAGVLKLFEFCAFSSDHNSIKPSPAMFARAFEPFGVGKHEAAFVGDSLAHDIAGAKAFGLSAIWIDSTGAGSAASGSFEADYAVADLRELAA